MSEKSVPAGKWKLRPFDPKCKTFVDHDPVVEEVIRCRVPLWTGDFWEVEPELTSTMKVPFERLPDLTVYRIAQYVSRTVQGGPLHYGEVGTAKHAIVTAPPFAPAAEQDDWHASIARGLKTTPKRVLWFMRQNNARCAGDKLTRQFIAESLGLSIDDVQAAGKVFRHLQKPLIESGDGRGGGWWLSPDGDRVAEHCSPPVARVATLTQSRKAK